MEPTADGKAEVSDELKGAETFRKNVHILDLLTQEYDTDLRQVWNMMTSESEASYEPEELKDPGPQVYALEHSLELEKGWSAKLEAEVWQLKRKLRLLQARYERLRCKYKRPVKHLLTRSIEEMLYGKERMSPSIFKVSQS